MSETLIDAEFSAMHRKTNSRESCFACCGNTNWLPPNAMVHGLIAPKPNAAISRPRIVNVLESTMRYVCVYKQRGKFAPSFVG